MIELRHLRYFIAVAEELSFRRAAERIHIDQTPLSRAVRDLEERLGVTLLVRAPRKLRLTPAGVCLLREARKVLIRVERTQRVVRDTDAFFHAPLRIGVADDIAQSKLSECIRRWREIAPEAPLELTEMRADELSAALKSEEVDLGISFGVLNDELIVQEPAWSYPVMALLPVKHKLARHTSLPIAELLVSPLISCHADRQPGLLYQMRTIVRRHIAKPNLAGDASTLAGYITRVAAGMGVGLADAGHVATMHRADVVAVPLAEDEYITTYVLYKQRRFGMRDALQRLLAHCKGMT